MGWGGVGWGGVGWGGVGWGVAWHGVVWCGVVWCGVGSFVLGTGESVCRVGAVRGVTLLYKRCGMSL